jgi:Zn-finger nucleic acid-binding protein
MRCPHDKRPLSRNDRHAFSRRECKKCGGMLLDEAFLKNALSRAKASSAAGQPTLDKLPESRVVCPRDRLPMRALLHSDVEIDICPRCLSVWLDRSEYEKIVAIGQIKKRDQAASYVSRYTDPDFNFAHFNLIDLADVIGDFVRGSPPDRT